MDHSQRSHAVLSPFPTKSGLNPHQFPLNFPPSLSLTDPDITTHQFPRVFQRICKIYHSIPYKLFILHTFLDHTLTTKPNTYLIDSKQFYNIQQ